MNIKKTRNFKKIFIFYFVLYLSLGIVAFIIDGLTGPHCFPSFGGSNCSTLFFVPIYYFIGFFVLVITLILIGSINIFITKGEKISNQLTTSSQQTINNEKGKRLGILILPTIIISMAVLLLSKIFFYLLLIIIFLLSLTCLLKIQLNLKNSSYIVISFAGIFYTFFYLLIKLT